jgi:acyl carrier protein
MDLITNKILSLISASLGVDIADLTFTKRIREDLGADSLDAAELILSLKSEFDIHINDDEISKIITVEDILILVNERMSNGNK